MNAIQRLIFEKAIFMPMTIRKSLLRKQDKYSRIPTLKQISDY